MPHVDDSVRNRTSAGVENVALHDEWLAWVGAIVEAVKVALDLCLAPDHWIWNEGVPADIVPAIREAVDVTESGAPFLLEFVVKEGYDFSRYELAGL